MSKTQNAVVVGAVVLLVAAGLWYGLSRPGKAVEEKKAADAIPQDLSLNESSADTKPMDNDTNTGGNGSVTALKVVTTHEGSGQAAASGDTIAMNYTGRLLDGTVFDSNVDPKFGHVQPFVFNLGTGMVIQGWDQGIVGMKVGEKRTLTIPANLAYGDRSPSPLIPANSDMVFEVELLAIK